MGILIHFSKTVKSGDGYRGADPVMFALGDAQHVIVRVREVSLFGNLSALALEVVSVYGRISRERKKSICCVVKPYADLTSSGPRYSRNCLASTGFFSCL